MTRLLPVPLPRSGAVRVHPAPEALPQLRHEGPGRNRFDDPHGSFLMRYTAENLRGCLVETMARFRPNPAADALLAAVEFVDADADPAVPTVQAVADWLAEPAGCRRHWIISFFVSARRRRVCQWRRQDPPGGFSADSTRAGLGLWQVGGAPKSTVHRFVRRRCAPPTSCGLSAPGELTTRHRAQRVTGAEYRQFFRMDDRHVLVSLVGCRQAPAPMIQKRR